LVDFYGPRKEPPADGSSSSVARRRGLLILSAVLAVLAVAAGLGAAGAFDNADPASGLADIEVAVSLGVSVLLALGAIWAFMEARR
jgi:hypothetical protein